MAGALYYARARPMDRGDGLHKRLSSVAVAGLEVLVVGGGTMGLATAWALARRGVAARVVERHQHVHALGSHGGHTRAVRHAYHEGSHYVPLVQEADRAFAELGQRRGDTLLVRTGLLEFGPADSPEYRSALEACNTCGLEHERVAGRDARRRWPFAIPDDWEACLTPSGGYLRVAPCLDAFRDEARAGGATFDYGARAVALHCQSRGVTAELEDGRTVTANKVVVAAGVGLPELMPHLRVRLARLRRVLFWTQPDPAHVAALRVLPIWAAFVPGGFFYGFPHRDEGVAGLKLACHQSQAIDGLDHPVDPEFVDRDVRDADRAPIERFISEFFPAALGPFVATATCMYTATPSWDFLVDRDPADPRVVIVGGFSGHGFKFAPTVGRIAAELVLGESEPPPQFSLARHGP